MEESTADDWRKIAGEYAPFVKALPDRLIAHALRWDGFGNVQLDVSHEDLLGAGIKLGHRLLDRRGGGGVPLRLEHRFPREAVKQLDEEAKAVRGTLDEVRAEDAHATRRMRGAPARADSAHRFRPAAIHSRRRSVLSFARRGRCAA